MIVRCTNGNKKESTFIVISGDSLGQGLELHRQTYEDKKKKLEADSLTTDAIYKVQTRSAGQMNYITSTLILPSGVSGNNALYFTEIFDQANFGLAWDKYPIFEGEKFAVVNKERTGLSAYQSLGISHRNTTNIAAFISALTSTNEEHTEGLSVAGYITYTADARTRWRMVCGMGEQQVHENNMVLHRIYGIPYIPGSSIKGKLRRLIIKKYFSGEQEALRNETFRLIFGSSKGDTGNRGGVFFNDAFPITVPVIVPDVISVHYPDYYKKEGQISAHDSEKINPIYFIAVERTTFRISLAIKESLNNTGVFSFGNTRYASLLEVVTAHLPELINEFGLGAKTRKGYGKLTNG